MGVCSLHPEAGISTGDFEEASVKRALCNAADQTIVMASPEKLDTASPFQIAPLTQVSGIVVSAGASESLIAPYRKIGIAITMA
jgi:DeoR/GlpR family transcriptional regulator of sugar metabolism